MDNTIMSTVSEILEELRAKKMDLEFRWTPDGFGLIGYSLDAYGTYSSHENELGYDNFIRQIPEAGHAEQLIFEL
jgi:hypothetical protein